MPETRSTEVRPGDWERRWPAHATALSLTASALLLGVYADVGQYAPAFWGWLPEVGTPWVVVAFFGGRATRSRPLGSLAGAGLILLGLGAYAAWVRVTYGTSLYNITNDGRAASWACLAILLGSVSGLAGSRTRTGGERQRQLAWGFAVGVPVAEAVHVLSAPAQPYPVSLSLILLTTAALLATIASRKVSWGGLIASAAGWACAGFTASLVLY